MYLQQKDIFEAMPKDFVKEIMDISVTESHQQGEVLFRDGERAEAFYVLLQGRVKLSLGETGQIVYVVSNAGEAFGWSSLIGRERFSATAECMATAKLLRFDHVKLQKILEKNPAHGLILFQRLAELLGNRLVQSYAIISSAVQAEISPSYGTGQVMPSAETQSEM